MSNNCYCGQPRSYSECCEPLHQGRQKATTAEQLMRSRYSAFCVHQVDYLLATHHPSQQSEEEKEALQHSCSLQQWVYLDIRGCEKGGPKDQQGEVEFVAWYIANAHSPSEKCELHQLRERSRFRCEQGQWYYLDGDILPPLPQKQPNPGRNAPCWCGSGTKFKRCHAREGV